MPAARRNQNNALLYTLIAFVGLFIVAVVVAVVFYIKFEDQRTTADQSLSQLREMTTTREWQNIGKIVGAKKTRDTYLGRMTDYLDQMVSSIIGGPLEETSAEVKVDNVNRELEETLKLLTQEHPDMENLDPNTTGLIRIVKKLKMTLDHTTNAVLALEDQLKQLHNNFDDFKAQTQQKEEALSAENKKYKQQVTKIKHDYDELEALMRQTSDDRAQTLMDQRDQARAQRDRTQADLLQTGAKLTIAEERIAHLQKQIWAVAPPPDSNVPAYKPDGKIMLVDNQIVHLNIGSDDRVYRGLTFVVYNKGMPIPGNGRGKAEIEIYDVGKSVSAARVTRSEIKRPIVVDDIVANLVWDSDKTNRFVVAGEFDLNADGRIDYDAVDNIKTLIVKWGGTVADTVSIDTDFLVLGRPPRNPRMPTAEELDVDPMATEKYQAALKKLAHYNQVKRQARDLWIPVFSTERFLYFIGFKTLATRPGAF